MNGSSSFVGTPANARRTGKPSPSKPLGAVVSRRTGRKTVVAGSSSGSRGRTRMSSTVIAGMGSDLPDFGEDTGDDGEFVLVEVIDEALSDGGQMGRRGAEHVPRPGENPSRPASSPIRRRRSGASDSTTSTW